MGSKNKHGQRELVPMVAMMRNLNISGTLLKSFFISATRFFLFVLHFSMGCDGLTTADLMALTAAVMWSHAFQFFGQSNCIGKLGL